jgi:hypothetical protein
MVAYRTQHTVVLVLMKISPGKQARALARRARELKREAAELAALPNVRVFDTEHAARQSWNKHLGVAALVCRGGEWRPGGRRIRRA